MGVILKIEASKIKNFNTIQLKATEKSNVATREQDKEVAGKQASSSIRAYVSSQVSFGKRI